MLHFFQTGKPDFKQAVLDLAEWELLARAQKDWYYAMMSYITGDDSDAEEESK